MTPNTASPFRRFLRDPLMHFFVAGACLYLVYFAVAEPEVEVDDKTVVVSQRDIEWLAAGWQKQWNRMPTQQELDSLIAHLVRETVLYREALDMGLDKDDAVIRRRLAQKVEFLTQDLLQPPAATEQELTAFFEQNIADYQAPSRVTFSQVFFDAERRGDATIPDAEAALAILQQTPTDQIDLNEFGDALLLPPHLVNKTAAEVDRQFGPGFAAPIFTETPGGWFGPVLSSYGIHLVFVDERLDPATPVLADVRDRVRADWNDLKAAELNDAFLEQLMARYTIVFEPASGVDVIGEGS